MPPLRCVSLYLLIFIYSVCLSLQNPIITSITSEQIKDIGDAVQLNCTVENVDDFSVIWSKRSREHPSDSVVLAIKNSLTLKDSRYKLYENLLDSSITYTLEINPIEAIDMGIYECQVATSPSEKIQSTVELLVRHPPRFLLGITPKSVYVMEGEYAEVTCNAEGYPSPTISWRRELNAIMPTGGYTFLGNTLKFKRTHRFDRGIYYCVADNGVGSPEERPVEIEIEFSPIIRVPRPKVAQAPQYDIELECKVEAFPAPAVVWYKDGVQISSMGDFRITNIATANQITNSVLRITSMDSRKYGDYYCNATNKMGQAEERINLYATKIPDINYPGLQWIANSSNDEFKTNLVLLNCLIIIILEIFLYI